MHPPSDDPPALGFIDLSGRTPLFRGNVREVYELPDQPQLLLKTIRTDITDSSGNVLRRGRLENMRPLGCYRTMHREFVEFLIQCRRRHSAEQFRLPIAHPVGFVATSHGLGMLVEKIVGDDGRPAPTYAQLAARGLAANEARALRVFTRRCQAVHLVLGDVHAENLVYTELRSGRPECVCIDGFGQKTVIPLLRWSRRLNAWNVSRLVDRVQDQLAALAPPAAASAATRSFSG